MMHKVPVNKSVTDIFSLDANVFLNRPNGNYDESDQFNAFWAVRIHPNPASAVVSIDIAESMVGGILTISDKTGKMMMCLQLIYNTTEIATEHLPAGIYFISVSNGGQTTSQKLVIEH